MKLVNIERFSALVSLRNRYFVLRHGESEANVTQLIVGDPSVGIKGFGLTEKGLSQVIASIEQATFLDENCLIISSDFKRAKETAQCVSGLLKSKVQIDYDSGLRERFFGEFECTHTRNYKKVWANDLRGIDLGDYYGVEPVSSVLERVLGVLLAQEESYEDKDILLVSHGDVLQILQTAFDRIEVSLHRDVQHLSTAEIRPLPRDGDK